MTGRARITLALCVFALAAFGVLAVRHHRASTVAAAAGHEGEAAPRFAFAWPKGKAYRYRFAWTADSTLSLEPGSGSGGMHGAADLTGVLVLRSYGPRQGGTAFAVSVGEIGRHQLELLGADALPDAARVREVFDGRTAIADVGPTGAVRAVSFTRGDPEMFKSVVERLLAAVTLTLPEGGAVPGAAWGASEEGPSGKAQVAYALDMDGLAVARRRDRYDVLSAIPAWMRKGTEEKLAASASAHVDPAGHVRDVVDDERLTVTRSGSTVLASTAHVEVHLDAVTEWDAPTELTILEGVMDTRKPGEHPVSKETEAKLLEQRVAGLTATELGQQVAIFAASSSDADRNRWASRASGLLIAHPELCAALADQFRKPGTTYKGRALVLDLLAMAGTPEAQAAMRDALRSPEAVRDAHEHAMLVQRFSFVARPEADSVALVAAVAKSGGTADERIAGQYALGAAVKQLGRAGDEAAARAWHATLASDLAAAKTPEAKRASLAALGNAGRAEDVPALVRFSQNDGDATVRASAAWALRSQPGDAAGDALVSAATDAEPQVGRAALEALGARGLDDGDTRALATAVLAGRTSKDTDAALVNAFGRRAVDSTDARRALQAVLARNENDAELAARIRQLLAFAGGAL